MWKDSQTEEVYAWAGVKLLSPEHMSDQWTMMVKWSRFNEGTQKWESNGEVTEQEFGQWMRQCCGPDTVKLLEMALGNQVATEGELHDSLSTEIQLVGKVNELKTSLHTSRDNCTRLAAKNSEQALAISGLEKECAALEAKSAAPFFVFTDEGAELEARAVKAENQVEKLRKTCQERTKLIAADTQELKDNGVKINYLEKQVDSLETQVNVSTGKNVAFEATLQLRDDRIEELEARVKELGDKFKDTTSTLAIQTANGLRAQKGKRKAEAALTQVSAKARKAIADIYELVAKAKVDGSCSPPPTLTSSSSSSFRGTGAAASASAGHAAAK